MLKATLFPIMATFPAKNKSERLSRTISRALTQSPQPVRQNVSTSSTNTSTTFALFETTPPTSAYIHLPFCRKRCHYCDFPIIALGSSSPHLEEDPRISNYINTLCREINTTQLNASDFSHNLPLQTVFFGGGTPSLVPPKLVSLILNTLRLKFGVSLGAEISIEMDPGTFDADKINGLKDLGVNRVSLGVQAFQDKLLNACGRAHDVKGVYEAIEIVRSSGIGNWSMDLISSLPYQTVEMWEESLKLTLQAQPTHISVYDLQVEQGTKFGILYTPGEFPLPSETQSAEFYRMASKMLTDAGYNHYEISSYCKNSYECKHNLTYWRNKPFYAFGLGSTSYLGGKRFSRPKRLKEYTGYVQSLENKIVEDHECTLVDTKDIAMDIVMLSLRTAWGLDLRSFEEAFGSSVADSVFNAYRPFVESGHVVCLDENRMPISMDKFFSSQSVGGRQQNVTSIRLSDPDGFLLSNELISVAFRAIAP